MRIGGLLGNARRPNPNPIVPDFPNQSIRFAALLARDGKLLHGDEEIVPSLIVRAMACPVAKFGGEATSFAGRNTVELRVRPPIFWR
jgi:hypothetical protein